MVTWLREQIAGAGFEAARSAGGRLHGHSFRAEARGVGLLPLPDVVAALDHRLLDELMPASDDAALADWLAAGLQQRGSAPRQLGLDSGPRRGAIWRPGRTSHWQRHRFEAAHQLPHVAPGHKCGRMHGHGFVVRIETASAHAHEAIEAAWAPLLFVLHRRCLNQIDGLANPTSEVLAGWLWRALQEPLPQLERVTVYETGSSGAAFDGRRHHIWKTFTLDSAVLDGDELLGHTYELRLHLGGALHERYGWVVDFGDVKSLFQPLFEQLDHRSLHELTDAPALDAGSLAQWIADRVRPGLPQLDRVELFETPDVGAAVASTPEAL